MGLVAAVAELYTLGRYATAQPRLEAESLGRITPLLDKSNRRRHFSDRLLHRWRDFPHRVLGLCSILFSRLRDRWLASCDTPCPLHVLDCGDEHLDGRRIACRYLVTDYQSVRDLTMRCSEPGGDVAVAIGASHAPGR